jgi:uncharacterized protein YyaL (SSP411 family)
MDFLLHRLAFLFLTVVAGSSINAQEPNRLAQESSPYLRQHARNPVDWYPWGEEAFAKARAENKPIFLSIGYSTCHWCHVMADESFSNAAVAAQLNEYFVSIKVDREERPDIDHIYMAFVQASTGSGGWPLNVWLTPELNPFYGGTYFSPQRNGRTPGFTDVLTHITELWEQDNQSVREQSAQMLALLANNLNSTPLDAGQLDWNLARTDALAATVAQYDPIHGGFGSRQKFPSGPTLQFLVDASVTAADQSQRAQALQMLSHTLRSISTQGLHDHVGGGFHRYTVDAAWEVPHFEKMLYDQAQIVDALISAWQLTGDDLFRQTATAALHYVRDRLTHPDGGFYSAEDAVSLPTAHAAEKVEGAYYTWTHHELATLLESSELAIFQAAFGIGDDGNVSPGEDTRGELKGQNVLRRRPTDEIAAEFKLTEREVNAKLDRALARLKTAQQQRPRPHLDDKIITAWNGLMISALARAGQVFGDPVFTTAAQRAAHYLRDHLYDQTTGTLARSYRDGHGSAVGFAEDYAFLIQGLIDLYETDFDTHWLAWALELQAQQQTLFWDVAKGGYFASDGNDASVVLRVKVEHDGAEPAATSVAVRNLGRLAALLHDDGLLAQARRAAGSLSGVWSGSPTALPQLVAAAGWLKGDAQQALFHANPDDPNLAELLQEVRSRFHPRRVTVRIDATSRSFFQPLVPVIAALPDEVPTIAMAYICENFVCQLPTHDRTELAELLDRGVRF